jgi:hypothetical protein
VYGRIALVGLGLLCILVGTTLWLSGFRLTPTGCLAAGLADSRWQPDEVIRQIPMPEGQILVASSGDAFHLVMLERHWGLCVVRGSQMGVSIPDDRPLGVVGAFAHIQERPVTAVAVVVHDDRVRSLRNAASQEEITVQKPGVYTFLVYGPYQNQSLEIEARDRDGQVLTRSTAWQPTPGGKEWAQPDQP